MNRTMKMRQHAFLMGCALAAAAVLAPASFAQDASSSSPTRYEDVPTQFVEANGTRYAYRRFGQDTGVPLVLFAHFRASMDNWDPRLVNNLAAGRTVIAFNNKGVSSSSGETPDTIMAMADDAAAFIAALGYDTVDVLGFSIGGAVTQELMFRHPALVRRAVLAGTGPQGAEGIRAGDPRIGEVARKTPVELTDFLFLFFEQTPGSQAAGRAFIERRSVPRVDPDPASTEQTMLAQGAASAAYWSNKTDGPPKLANVTSPVLVANGRNDIMIATSNSLRLFELLPDAQLILYPDSGHGFLFQYPDLFAKHVAIFLDDDAGSGQDHAR